MVKKNPLKINQIEDFLNGGGLPFRSDYISVDKHFTKDVIGKFKELGWTENFLRKRFVHLNDKLLDQWTINQFIEEYTNHIIDTPDIDDSIFKNLKKIGLSSQVARHLNHIFSPIKDTCYTNSQLINIAVEYLLGRNKPMIADDGTRRECIPTVDHPFDTNSVGKWFFEKNYRQRIMNLPCSDIKNILKYINRNTISTLQYNKKDSDLYYHSTSWQSCINIMENGISCSKGRTYLDFGQEPGFYMWDTLKDAIMWTKNNSNQNYTEDAIIVFSLPKQLPEDLKYKELKDDEWASVTKKSRSRVKNDKNIPEIHRCGLVYGDMVANPNEVERGGEPRPTNPPKKQLVSRRDIANDYIFERIVGVLFFKKNYRICHAKY